MKYTQDELREFAEWVLFWGWSIENAARELQQTWRCDNAQEELYAAVLFAAHRCPLIMKKFPGMCFHPSAMAIAAGLNADTPAGIVADWYDDHGDTDIAAVIRKRRGIFDPAQRI